MVDHVGCLEGGHYTATILSNEDNTWYEFNDQHVNKVSRILLNVSCQDSTHTDGCENQNLWLPFPLVCYRFNHTNRESQTLNGNLLTLSFCMVQLKEQPFAGTGPYKYV